MGVMRTSLGEPGPAFFPEAAEPYVQDAQAHWYDPPAIPVNALVPARAPFLGQRDVASLGDAYGFWSARGSGPPGSVQLQVVDEQITRAKHGQWIATYKDAGAPAYMWTSPANTTGAWLRVAFWLAVAARVSRNAVYIGAAETARSAAATLLMRTGADDSDQAIGQVLATGAQQVLSMAQGNPQLLGIAKILSETGTAQAIASAKAVARGKNTMSNAGQAISQTASVVTAPFVAAADIARAAADPNQRPWWFWPVVIGGGTIGTALLLGYFARPYAGLAREAYGDAKKAVKAARDAALRKNGRKSKSRSKSRPKSRR
jgi:hypothetical protein